MVRWEEEVRRRSMERSMLWILAARQAGNASSPSSYNPHITSKAASLLKSSLRRSQKQQGQPEPWPAKQREQRGTGTSDHLEETQQELRASGQVGFVFVYFCIFIFLFFCICVFVYLRICVFVYLHLIHGNVIFDILESHAFQKYSTCWVLSLSLSL